MKEKECEREEIKVRAAVSFAPQIPNLNKRFKCTTAAATECYITQRWSYETFTNTPVLFEFHSSSAEYSALGIWEDSGHSSMQNTHTLTIPGHWGVYPNSSHWDGCWDG